MTKITKTNSKLLYFLTIALTLFPLLSPAQDFENNQNPAEIKYHIIKKSETLYKIANSFDLGFDEILQANPQISDPQLIYTGEKIILPTTHLTPDVKTQGIVINLAETRLYFFPSEEEVISFPISIGDDEKTPTGKTKIIAKRENPSWIPPQSIREENPELPEIVPPGPDNPLGNYALYLDGSKNFKWQNIMIHGTNAPQSIGSRVSHGCIRLYPQDIEKLFNLIEIDTPVTIVNQPIKVSELVGRIYMEVHLQEAPDIVSEEIGVKKLICKKIKNCETKINLDKVDEVVLDNLGIPIDVSY